MTATIRIFSTGENVRESISAIAEYFCGGGGPGGYYVKDSKKGKKKKKSPEAQGKWLSSGARELGLTGEVTRKELYNLMRGKSPCGKKQLTRIQKKAERSQGKGDDSPADDDDDGDEGYGGGGYGGEGSGGEGSGGGGGALGGEGPDTSEGVRTRKRARRKALDLGKSKKNEAQKRSTKNRKKKRAEHVPGFDITFSCPKEVSMMWALGDPVTRRTIEEAVEKAVVDTMLLLESQLPLIRRGKGGATREFGKLVYSRFQHFSARNNNDPNLHDHVLVMNMIKGANGTWYKIDSHTLLKFIRTLGPLYRNNLYCNLREGLGVEAYRPIDNGKPASWFALKGFHEGLKAKWSSRRDELLDAVELAGTTVADAKAKQSANLRTRQPKDPGLSLSDLEEKWRKEAAEFGVSRQSLNESFGRTISIDVEARLAQAAKTATEKLTEQNAAFTRSDLIRAVSEELQDVPIQAKNVIAFVDHTLKQSPELKLVNEQGHDKIYTTQQMWRLEEELAEKVDKLAAKPGLAISERCISKALAKNPKLSEEQKKCVREVLSKEGSLACITGIAGAGKSTTLKAVVDALELSGKNVIGLSLGAAPARNLQEKTGAESFTIAKFLYHREKPLLEELTNGAKHHLRMYAREIAGMSTWKKSEAVVPKPDKNTVVLFDEAATTNTELMNRVFTQVEQTGAALIAIGDRHQNPPIGAGDPFKQMIDKVGSATLSENWRQTPLEAKASQHVREGETEEALAIYAKAGNLKVAPSRREAAQELVSDWMADCGRNKPQEAMILVQTNTEVDQVNRMCQNARLLESAISPRHVKVGESKFHVGDRVMFVEARTKHGIVNSDMATVSKIGIRGDVTLVRDREITKRERAEGLRKELTLTRKELSPSLLRLGYAATVSKLQGASIDKIFALAGGKMTSLNHFYVTVSRSIQKVRIYIDRDHAGHKLADIAQAASRLIEKKSAHELSHQIKNS